MKELTDEELVRAWQEGPRINSYIDELFRRHYRRVGLWCLRFAGDRDTAADWAQDVFMTAYRNLASFRGDSKFSTWLYTIARNHCRNQIRANFQRPEPEGDFLLESFADVKAGDAHARMENENAAAVLRDLMRESLNDTEQKVLTLHYQEELPLDAITRVLGLANVSGAKAYVVSARRKLQEAARRWKAREQGAGAGYGKS